MPPTSRALTTPASGVRAPAEKFSAERLKLAATGSAPPIADAAFAAPSAYSSWSVSTRSRRRLARPCAMDTLLT